MRIIVATSSENRSGGTRQALYLAQGLLERGHEVTMFVPQSSELPPLVPSHMDLRFLGARMQWRQAIEAALPDPHGRNSVPCVFHAFHNAMVKQAAWWGLFWHRRRVAVTAHRGVISRPRNPLPYLSPGINKFMVNSHYCADIIRPYTLWRPGKVEVVYNSIPDERVIPGRDPQAVRAELGLASDDFVLGMVGNNSPNKGIKPLLEAFALLLKKHSTNKRLKLVLVGVSADLWSPLVSEFDLADKVRIIDKTESVADYVQLFEMFILPSLMESLPNTLLEAIRMGRPCIGSAVGDVPLLLRNCGLCVPPADPEALSSAMLRLVEDDAMRLELAAAAVKDASLYTQEARLNKVLGIYNQILEKI